MMAEGGMEEAAQLEALLAMAEEASLEVRVLSSAAAAREHAPTGSAACRVGARVWVVLAPDDPVAHQVDVLAGALARYLGTDLVTIAREVLKDRLRQEESPGGSAQICVDCNRAGTPLMEIVTFRVKNICLLNGL